ncbi:MAG: GHKL domain-containing protein, partial [Bacteroidetes bacterium]|nr:GHKL domain-containing protein [Bacteroidota bacterium]
KYNELNENDDLGIKLKEIEKMKKDLELPVLVDEVKILLEGIEEGANRTAEIVRSLRIFSRLDEHDLKYADINEGLDSTVRLLNGDLKGLINLERIYGDIPKIDCYAGKLNQLFVNLINNAAQAINDRYQGGKEGKITIETSKINGSIIKIVIRDNGTGMNEKTKEKIFEPFFTTKEVGVGTGLGLSIAYSIIQDHNGEIKVQSEEGVGTEFQILLPINQSLEQKPN